MRIKHAIFIGVVAALATLTAPALAKNSNPRREVRSSKRGEQA
jgi:hypothetical protein